MRVPRWGKHASPMSNCVTPSPANQPRPQLCCAPRKQEESEGQGHRGAGVVGNPRREWRGSWGCKEEGVLRGRDVFSEHRKGRKSGERSKSRRKVAPVTTIPRFLTLCHCYLASALAQGEVTSSFTWRERLKRVGSELKGVWDRAVTHLPDAG